MFTKSIPELREERYWVFIDYSVGPWITKVKTVRRWFDKTNKTNVTKVKVIEDIFGESEYFKGAEVNIDFPWQLQETLEDAMKLMITAIFSLEGIDSFYWRKPPWE